MRIRSRIATLAFCLLLGQAAAIALPQAASAEWTEANPPCNVWPGAMFPQQVSPELGEPTEARAGYFTYGEPYPPPESDFTATANWGDGTTSPATVGSTTVGDCYAVSAPSHIYASAGLYPFSYTVYDSTTGLSHTLDAEDLRVWSEAPTLLGGPTTRTIHATVGDRWSGVVGEFSLEGDATDTAEIEWEAGGPSSSGTVTTLDQQAGVVFERRTIAVSGSFTYMRPFTGTIRVLLGGWKPLGAWVTSGVDVVAPVVAVSPAPVELRAGSILAAIPRAAGGALYELVFRTDRRLPQTRSGQIEAHVKANGQIHPISHLTAGESTCYVARLDEIGKGRPRLGARYPFTLAIDSGRLTRDGGHALLSRFATLRSMRSIVAGRLGCA